jgi:hypothetical protein
MSKKKEKKDQSKIEINRYKCTNCENKGKMSIYLAYRGSGKKIRFQMGRGNRFSIKLLNIASLIL